MSDEYLYALAIEPSGRVKLGRTSQPGRRLGQHVSAARFGGGAITRSYFAVCANSTDAERALLAAAAHLPGVTVVHAHETFAGLAFAQAVDLVDRVVAGEVTAPDADTVAAYPDLLDDVRACLDATPTGRMHIGDLLDVLPATYAHLNAVSLGAALRAAGVPTPQVKLRGRNSTGVRREHLAA